MSKEIEELERDLSSIMDGEKTEEIKREASVGPPGSGQTTGGIEMVDTMRGTRVAPYDDTRIKSDSEAEEGIHLRSASLEHMQKAHFENNLERN